MCKKYHSSFPYLFVIRLFIYLLIMDLFHLLIDSHIVCVITFISFGYFPLQKKIYNELLIKLCSRFEITIHKNTDQFFFLYFFFVFLYVYHHLSGNKIKINYCIQSYLHSNTCNDLRVLRRR